MSLEFRYSLHTLLQREREREGERERELSFQMYVSIFYLWYTIYLYKE